MTSFSKPTNDLVRAAVAKLSAPVHERYFFDQLKNPHWISPLKELGLFNGPPALIQVENGRLRCPPWPQSRYLARMAAIAPEEVASVLANIHTENWVVAHDIVNAAKAMPASIAERLVDVIGGAFQHSMVDDLISDVGELVAALAAGGQPDAALRLAQNAFAIKDGDLNAPSGRYEEHFYFDAMMDHVVPSLAVARPFEFIRLLLGWMEQVLEGRGSARELDRTSYIWRPAIEDHDQNRDFTFAAKMVSIMRSACEVGIQSGVVSLNDVLAMAQSTSGQVLSRLRIHLIAEFAEQNTILARDTMMDQELFKNTWSKHEYARLMGMRWRLLNSSDHELWLFWVDAGPEEIIDDCYNHPVDEAYTTKLRAYWQFQRLYWIRDHLNGERRAFYDQMLGEHGLPELADLNVHQSGVRWLGHESPMSAETLAAMGFRHAVEAVTKWQPNSTNQGYDEPDVEGLAREFQNLIARDSLAASKEAAAMEASRPIFVRHYLQAMVSAIKEGKEIDLQSVTALARWVVERPAEETDPTSDSWRWIDRDWQCSRDTVASLIEEVAKARDAAGSLRFDLIHRDEIWAVVRALPTCPPIEYIMRDESEDPREVDWPMALLNSTRGKAMRAVFAYADWVASNLVLGDRSRVSLQNGFNMMPEVRALLENELIRPDADCAGHAAFGWRLGLIFWIDSSWVKANVERIFDLHALEVDPAKAFGWAAWSAFLFAHRPHIEFYNLLREQFSYAVDQSSRVSSNNREKKVWSLLGEHLIVLFGRGKFGLDGDVGLDADRGIIRRLVTDTHVSVRSHAIQFVGNNLSGLGEDLPNDIIKRFKFLWDQYWNAVGKTDAEATPQSAVFGYWFCSGAFDPQWSLERLLAFVTTAQRAEPDNMIVEQLAKICPNEPLRAAQVIQMLVLGDMEGWRVSSWKSDAMKVLKVAILADGEARLVAEEVVDRLGRRGFSEFGELFAFYK